MRRVVHTWRILREFGSYSAINRVYWILPLVVVLLLLALLVAVVEIAVPFTLYPLF